MKATPAQRGRGGIVTWCKQEPWARPVSPVRDWGSGDGGCFARGGLKSPSGDCGSWNAIQGDT